MYILLSSHGIIEAKKESGMYAGRIIEKGTVMANIKIEVTEPNVITAIITKESAEKLGLAEGDDVTAIIKSTEVIIGK